MSINSVKSAIALSLGQLVRIDAVEPLTVLLVHNST